MKKPILLLITAVMGVLLAFGGCSDTSGSSSSATVDQAQMEAPAPTEISSQFAEESAVTKEGPVTEGVSGREDPELTYQVGVRVGLLKGPISTGLVSLMSKTSKGETVNIYEFTMTGKVDELVDKIASGDLDTALVPVNVANVLYNKTQGSIMILDTNILDVLYVVASDDSVTSVTNLKDRSIYTTGKGTTPEYVMNYLLKGNGFSISDVSLQLKSKATEMVFPPKEDLSATDVLPRPFTTTACIQNPDLKTVLGLIEQWNLLDKDAGSTLVIGITPIRNDFSRGNQVPIAGFPEGHTQFALFAAEHVEETVELIATQSTVEKAPIIQKALPYCNIVCLTDQEMKDVLSGYLFILMKQDPKSIGGQLSGGDFCYML